MYVHWHAVYVCFCNAGQFRIPVKCLVEPAASRLIRQPHEPYIKGLKEEMKKNPTCDVAPIVAMVKLTDGQKFDEAHPEAFTYETLGGNHSRIALQELLNEDKQLATLPYYRSRLVSVYSGLSDKQATHLALRHNKATEYTSKLTTQDKVGVCLCPMHCESLYNTKNKIIMCLCILYL